MRTDIYQQGDQAREKGISSIENDRVAYCSKEQEAGSGKPETVSNDKIASIRLRLLATCSSLLLYDSLIMMHFSR
jgi:hypothetical protein